MLKKQRIFRLYYIFCAVAKQHVWAERSPHVAEVRDRRKGTFCHGWAINCAYSARTFLVLPY